MVTCSASLVDRDLYREREEMMAAASGVGCKGVPAVACEQKTKGELRNLRENSKLACTVHAARHRPENPARLARDNDADGDVLSHKNRRSCDYAV